MRFVKSVELVLTRVYKKGENRPVIVFQEGCVEGCRGCQNLCFYGAIQYVGDIERNGDCNSGCCS